MRKSGLLSLALHGAALLLLGGLIPPKEFAAAVGAQEKIVLIELATPREMATPRAASRANRVKRAFTEEREDGLASPSEMRPFRTPPSNSAQEESLLAVETSSPAGGTRFRPAPVYPERARLKRWEGLVLLDVEAGRDGNVNFARVTRTSGHSLLDEAALESVKRWKLQANSHALIPIIFRLRPEN